MVIIKICWGIGLFFVALFGFFSSTTSCDDSQTDLDFIMMSNPITFNTKPSEINLEQTSEVSLLFSSLIRGYQLLVSSQDGRSCVFVPSCSHFSMQAFQKCKIPKAILLTSDRLQRCNSLSRGWYQIDGTTGKAIDLLDYYISGNHAE